MVKISGFFLEGPALERNRTFNALRLFDREAFDARECGHANGCAFLARTIRRAAFAAASAAAEIAISLVCAVGTATHALISRTGTDAIRAGTRC